MVQHGDCDKRGGVVLVEDDVKAVVQSNSVNSVGEPRFGPMQRRRPRPRLRENKKEVNRMWEN